MVTSAISKAARQFIVIAGLAASAPASAALIEMDLFAPSDGFIIHDTVNNRDWVDVTKTTSMSISQSLAIYQPLGFRLATGTDVIQLFTAAGIPDLIVGTPFGADPGNGGTIANRAPVLALLALMEHASPWTATGGNEWVHGFIDVGSPLNVMLSRFGAFDSDNIGRANVYSNGAGWFYDTIHPAIGSFLVRDLGPISADEPIGILLMLTGIAGASLGRLRRRGHGTILSA